MAASPTRTVLRTEARLFLREPAALFWIILFPALLIGGLGQVPGYRDPEEGVDGVPVIVLYVPVAILLSMLLTAVSTMPVVLAGYREQLILKRIATTPARPRDLLIAQYTIHGGAAVAGGALAVLVVRIGYGTGLPGNAAAHLLALAATLAIGGLISALVPTAKISTTVGAILLFPLMSTAGVWLPVSAMVGLFGLNFGLVMFFDRFERGQARLAEERDATIRELERANARLAEAGTENEALQSRLVERAM